MKHMIYACLLAAAPFSSALSASLDDPVLQRGEEVYRQTCATSYCHGSEGAAAGAPRLAARDFTIDYLNDITANGVPGTPMAGFAAALADGDFEAVLVYVASLNGIDARDIDTLAPAARQPARIALTGAAQEGRELFFDAYGKGLDRCSTCHEVEGFGIAVSTPITSVPASTVALRNLPTPAVSTAALEGERMPALLLSQGVSGTLFYDLSVVPPVLRTVGPDTDVTFDGGSQWQHETAIRAYDDDELGKVLMFLRALY